MPDSLDDLLASCHIVSRAIRLLTAEAKRRATLLRLCCADYERSLDRLERLVAVTRQLDQDGAVPAPKSARNRGHAEAAIGIVSAHGQGDKSFGSTTLSTPGGANLPESAIAAHAAAAVRPGRASEYLASLEHDCDVGISASDGSSSITENLRQILEQARSIRTKEASSSRSRASTAGAEITVAADRSRTVTSRPARQSCPIDSGGGKQAPVGAMPTLGAGRHPSAANLMTAASTTTSSRRERSTTRATRSRRAQSNPFSAQSARGGHTEANAAPTYVTTGTTAARSGAAIPADKALSGSSRCGPFESHSTDVQAGSSEIFRGEYEGAASEDLGRSREVMPGLMDAILEETRRFMVSRAKLVGPRADCGRIGNDQHSGVSAAEDSLLLALESGPSRNADSALDQPARPDPHPHLATWPEMMPRGSSSELEAARWRDMHRHSGTPLGSVSGRQHQEHGGPSAMGANW
ncbi:unnamed protein product, partial [Laminaria digitata]